MSTRHTVLLLDRDEHHLSDLGAALRDASFGVRTSSSPIAAQQLMHEGGIDALITGRVFEEMRGTEIVTWARVHHPSIVRFVLTGRPSLDSALVAINSGAVERYLTKPCDVRELTRALNAALEARDRARQAEDFYRRFRSTDATQRLRNFPKIAEQPIPMDELLDELDHFLGSVGLDPDCR